MDVTTSRSDAISTIVVSGDIDVENAYSIFAAAVGEAESGSSRVVVDLAGVTFIDSIGLGMLVRSRDELADLYESTLALRNPSPRVRNLLAVTALTAEFAMDA